MNADGYEDRDFLIGLFFGSKSMSKKDIDKRIIEYIAGQLDEGFPDLLHQYFQKEHLMEKWLDDTFS